MIIGIIVGTYSSIFIAAPLVIVWEEWKQKRAAAKAPAAPAPRRPARRPRRRGPDERGARERRGRALRRRAGRPRMIPARECSRHVLIVFTDLDGTLLEEDGSLLRRGAGALAALRVRGASRRPADEQDAASSSRAGSRSSMPGAPGLSRTARGFFERETETPAGRRRRARAARRPRRAPAADGPAPLLVRRNPRRRDGDTSPASRSTEAAAARDGSSTFRSSPPQDAAERARPRPLPPRAPADARRPLLAPLGAHDKADALRLLVERLGGGPDDRARRRAERRRVPSGSSIIPSSSRGRRASTRRCAAALPDAAVAPAPAGAGWSAAVRALVADEEARRVRWR